MKVSHAELAEAITLLPDPERRRITFRKEWLWDGRRRWSVWTLEVE